MKDDVQLARWLNDEMNEEELKQFSSMPEFAAYAKIKDYSAQLTVPETDIDALYNSIAANRGRKDKVRALSPWYARVAAILVLALGITYYFYTTNTTLQMADAGHRQEFLLPDNSSVVLNAGSQAKFRSWNWRSNRKVELDGEAYFKVAKGEKFDVVTPLGKVTVVGTQFNVKSRNSRLDVTCFEGKVKVSNSKQTILLTPGKSISVENGKFISLPNDAMGQPGWLTYETRFVNEKLENVIAEIERQYNVTIRANAPLSQKPFTGSLPIKDLDAALDMIEPTYNLKATKSGSTILLTSE